MIKKLETITTQYRKFDTNQVLTESQLNEFLDYFGDQDHLSRIGLSGVGIVCGFNLEFVNYDNSLKDFKGGKPAIRISQGYGVTTDGRFINTSKP